MKIIRKCFIIMIVLILSILFVITINKFANATTKTNMIMVTGNVTDSKNKNISNVEVSFIDASTNQSVTTTKTDSNGEYIVNVPEGKYKVEFKYPENYNTKKINIHQYELYDKSLELGLVYNSNLEDTKIKYLDAKFTEEQYDFRLIKNSYSKDEEIENQIHSLQLNSESENAFHNLIYEGFKGVTIIFSDMQENEIQSYIDNYLNGDYNSIICKSQESMSNVLDKMYTKLEKKSKSIDIDTVENKEIEISSTTIMNVNAEKIGNTNLSNGVENSSSGNYPDFISGQIGVENGIHKKKVIIRLVDTETGNVKNTVNTDNGQYFISYPGKGKYKLEFEFENTNDFNGQYYEADTVSSNNCMTETNRENINEFYKKIGYDKEISLDDYINNGNEKIKGKSDTFYVPAISNNYNPNDNKIIKNVLLKQRDKFSLTVDENVNKFKIILSNGQTFKEYDLKTNLGNENYKIRLFNITMDNKISYGAKLLVEYEIKVTNNSNIDCKGYKLLNRFENLEFDQNQYLLSNTKEKNGNKWSFIKKPDGVEPITYIELKSKGIKANKEEKHYVTLTRLLDAENTPTIFNGTAELIEYENDKGRRNYENATLTGNVMDGIIRSGNYTTTMREADTALSEDIVILPPTGFNIRTRYLLIISTIVCLFGFKYLLNNKLLYINLIKSKKNK